jgi:hypothetical protein
MNKQSLSILFMERPPHWGLRGDLHLWSELKESSYTLPMPATAEEFSRLLHQSFRELFGQPLQPEEFLFVARYDSGGMSSGQMDCHFWLKKGFPLLLQR